MGSAPASLADNPFLITLLLEMQTTIFLRTEMSRKTEYVHNPCFLSANILKILGVFAENQKTKTIFQGTRIPLISWFEAIWTILSYKKGISSVQLGENIKVSQKTAWFMMHRIRKALGIDNDVGSEDEGGGGKLSGTVEIDETFNWRKEQEQALEQESSKKSR